MTLQYLEDMGHNVNGHRNHRQSWRGIDRWLRKTLPALYGVEALAFDGMLVEYEFWAAR